MRTMVVSFVLLILALTGCTATSPTPIKNVKPTQTVAPGTSNSQTGSFFAINEVGLGPSGYVALTNFTKQPATLKGLFLCQGTNCFELPNVEVAPAATARVAVGDGTGLEGVVATRATIGELKPVDGEVALYTSKDVSNPKAILMYLEWGSSPHQDTEAAIAAGLWVKGIFAPSSAKATRVYRTEGGLWLFAEK